MPLVDRVPLRFCRQAKTNHGFRSVNRALLGSRHPNLSTDCPCSSPAPIARPPPLPSMLRCSSRGAVCSADGAACGFHDRARRRQRHTLSLPISSAICCASSRRSLNPHRLRPLRTLRQSRSRTLLHPLPPIAPEPIADAPSSAPRPDAGAACRRCFIRSRHRAGAARGGFIRSQHRGAALGSLCSRRYPGARRPR